MKIFETIKQIQLYIETAKVKGESIGFVPTMGALHQGHMSLVQAARKENDLVVVSIFVNPIQFNNPDDLDKYPRTLEQDSAMLKAEGCDAIFYPSVAEMYPEKVSKDYDFGALAGVLEGACRPGHFNGVGIVVKKLFDIVAANKAYFGKKDFQQLAIIRKLVQLENIPIEIVACDTMREKDGLAMSSRNRRLSKEERDVAPIIYQTLKMVKKGMGHKTPKELEELAIEALQPDFKVEYFKLADGHSLQAISSWGDTNYPVALVAAFLGDVRLIDNLEL
ncbi:MAG: pantoate--beta-alanine ligase [Bacteroidales bacterium]|nr:pantoate--beta-alanine ligase [Bacteroidales bacterium]